MTRAEIERVARRFIPRITRMARGICRQLPPSVEVSDLAHAGVVGMMTALHSFDSRRGDRVDVYVTRRVRGAILDELRALDPLSRDQRRDARSIQGASRNLVGELGRTPDDGEIAARCGLDVLRVREVKERAARSVSLPLEAAARERDPAVADPLERLAVARHREALVTAVAWLGEREKTALSLYYVEDLSLKEIGHLLGVTESRVCQIHGAAVKKLRAALGAS